jgi:predicted naringenin-chalcone synthase
VSAQPESATSGPDRPASDLPASDRPASDRPASDRPASDRPASDRPARRRIGRPAPAVRHAAVLTGQGRAVPTAIGQREVWDEVFSPRLGGDSLARALFLRAGITTRHTAVDPRVDDVSHWTTGARMRRYVTEARGLGRDAVTRALRQAGLKAEDVGLFVVVSCTGYATPGLDILISDDVGMPPSVRRLIVGHMGCYAAIPGLGSAADFVRAQGQPAVVLCVELPSLHIQPSTDPKDLQTVVSHALFADAAAAVVIEPDAASGLEVLATSAVTAPGSAPLMTWEVTDHGFRMGLSPKVPGVLSLHVGDAVQSLIKPSGLDVADVAGWAVHPGGRRIVDVVAERLHLSPDQVADSRAVLDQYGNCSSSTVLMVLDRVRRREQPTAGDAVIAMAFGPGLTLCTALLRAR